MTAKEYIYRMLDIQPIKGSNYHMITASNVQIEACMTAFAQEKVKEAIRSVLMGRINEADLNTATEQHLKFLYPLENVK